MGLVPLYRIRRLLCYLDALIGDMIGLSSSVFYFVACIVFLATYALPEA